MEAAPEDHVLDQHPPVQEPTEGGCRRRRRRLPEASAAGMAGAISNGVLECGLAPEKPLGGLTVERSPVHGHGDMAELFQQLLERPVRRRAHGLKVERAGAPSFRPLEHPSGVPILNGDPAAESGDLLAPAGRVHPQIRRTQNGLALIEDLQPGAQCRLAAFPVAVGQPQQGFGVPGQGPDLGWAPPSGTGTSGAVARWPPPHRRFGRGSWPVGPRPGGAQGPGPPSRRSSAGRRCRPGWRRGVRRRTRTAWVMT
jgi:hypothetical protein